LTLSLPTRGRPDTLSEEVTGQRSEADEPDSTKIYCICESCQRLKNHLLLAPPQWNSARVSAADRCNVCKRPTLTDGSKQMDMERQCCVGILSDNSSPVVDPVAQWFQPCSYDSPLGHLFSSIMQNLNPHNVHRYHASPGRSPSDSGARTRTANFLTIQGVDR